MEKDDLAEKENEERTENSESEEEEEIYENDGISSCSDIDHQNKDLVKVDNE